MPSESILVQSVSVSGPSVVNEELNSCCVLVNLSGILVPGGFGVRGTAGKIHAINWARNQKKPFLGTGRPPRCAPLCPVEVSNPPSDSLLPQVCVWGCSWRCASSPGTSSAGKVKTPCSSSWQSFEFETDPPAFNSTDFLTGCHRRPHSRKLKSFISISNLFFVCCCFEVKSS